MNKLSMNHKIIYYLIPLIFTLFIIPSVYGIETVIGTSKDSHITGDWISFSNNTNYGGELSFNDFLDNGFTLTRGIFSFDIAGLNTDGLSNATLVLFTRVNVGIANETSCIREIEESEWIENEVTWENKSNGVAWNQEGAGWASLDNEVCLLYSEHVDIGFTVYNVTDLVLRLVSEGKTTLDFIVLSNEDVRFDYWLIHDSKEVVNETRRPQLYLSDVYVEWYVETIFEPSIESVTINGAGVSNNSFTPLIGGLFANFEVFGNMKYYKWHDSNQHHHVNPFTKLIDQNYTLTVLSRPQVIPLNTVSPMWLMIALISCFTLAYSGAIFGKKIFT